MRSLIHHHFCFQAKFKQFLYTGDFVLLELEEAIQFSEWASSACLSNSQIDPTELCMTAGWGADLKQGKCFFNLKITVFVTYKITL